MSGVSDAARMRSTLNVRRAARFSSQPIRYSAWVSAEGSIASGSDARRARAARRVVGAGVVLDLDHPPPGPGLGEDAKDAREGGVGRRRRERVDRRLDVEGQHRRQDLGELDEGADQLRVVLVARLGQHPGGKEERGCLMQRQRQRRQERLGVEAELALVAPDGQAGVQIHRLDIAIDGALGDTDVVGQRLGADAVRMVAQDHRDAQVARRTIPLRAAAVADGVHRRLRLCHALTLAPPANALTIGQG